MSAGTPTGTAAETPQRQRFCTSCGQALTGGASFCTACGVRARSASPPDAPPSGPPLEPPAAAPAPAPAPPPDAATASGGRGLLPVALVALAVVVALGGGVAILLLLRDSHDVGVRAQPAPAAPPAPAKEKTAASADAFPDSVRYRTASYSVRVPASWNRIADDVDHSVYQESKWRHPRADDITVLVDYTDGFRGSAREGAETLRDQTSAASDYSERSFKLVTIGPDRHAWRWEFTLGARHKVDYFFNGCGTGFAVLGEAPADRFVMYRATFERVVRSLRPAC